VSSRWSLLLDFALPSKYPSILTLCTRVLAVADCSVLCCLRPVIDALLGASPAIYGAGRAEANTKHGKEAVWAAGHTKTWVWDGAAAPVACRRRIRRHVALSQRRLRLHSGHGRPRYAALREMGGRAGDKLVGTWLHFVVYKMFNRTKGHLGIASKPVLHSLLIYSFLYLGWPSGR
jgi:hypothetical protein